jgi:hypothetical protein
VLQNSLRGAKETNRIWDEINHLRVKTLWVFSSFQYTIVISARAYSKQNLY